MYGDDGNGSLAMVLKRMMIVGDDTAKMVTDNGDFVMRMDDSDERVAEW